YHGGLRSLSPGFKSLIGRTYFIILKLKAPKILFHCFECLRIDTIDISEEMLQRARDKAEEKDVNLNLIKADITDFSFDRTFNTILLSFNTLQTLLDLEEYEALFSTVHDHLSQDGRFILQIFNPDLDPLTKINNINRRLIFREHMNVYQAGLDCSEVLYSLWKRTSGRYAAKKSKEEFVHHYFENPAVTSRAYIVKQDREKFGAVLLESYD
ncbi:MAG: class I SAM-dependent methyltransferase, partial [Candidatus Saliniplasma sp.]